MNRLKIIRAKNATTESKHKLSCPPPFPHVTSESCNVPSNIKTERGHEGEAANCPYVQKKLESSRLTGTQMSFISAANWVICESGTKYNIVLYMNKYQAGQPGITLTMTTHYKLIRRGRWAGPDGSSEEKISTRRRLLSNFTSTADEMRGAGE